MAVTGDKRAAIIAEVQACTKLVEVKHKRKGLCPHARFITVRFVTYCFNRSIAAEAVTFS
jgi:hypothetical protein